ncbi:hypothetical protein N7466_011184 [Penicillium verhagenii]|uniref:uncharacterized protein n=1 Tax=Penicillium verhagenii TaxID=1562060 RepID=UPI002545125A|nr:uncharacterized protein N7466_011184 [Penicillium verhagenii]KAJ5917630.1 hypothetical protein N7466_011184 [Penicillium verhagenii]
MTRPQIVRADTLDLQDHDAPSASDHSKQPEQPAPLGVGRPAPHQELSIRHAEKDLKSEISSGPENGHEYRDGVGVYGDDETEEDLDRDYEHEDGDLADGESDDMMDDDMLDKISSSPSIDDEDIDFEFVYALHNFVATVDGQANAAKGDTMVLLDDSNSYWWLVRVVKDGSIGYLPAEHIETPTERLARLNKHRNVDLSATMLGDNNEKSKNPLKKAMRRRNAKTVNFAPPTYIEASDVEYSSDEDSEHGDFFNDDETETVESEEGDSQDQSEDITVEPLRPKGQKEKPTEQAEVKRSEDSERTSYEPRPSSEEFFDPEEPIVSRSRNGTVRNTDSFFKDDTAEPKKISLTPNLLRDESNNTGSNGNSNSLLQEWKEGRGSFETIDKVSSPQDKAKEEKKRKEKKPGMLSGLFKRKDKKTKSPEDDFEEALTSPTESTFSQSKTSMESFDSKSSKSQRQTGNKLQKSHTAAMSPTSIESGTDAGQSIRRVVSRDATSFEEPRSILTSSNSHRSPSKESFVTPMEAQDPFASPVERPSSEAQWRSAYESPNQRAASQPSVASPPQRFVPTLVTARPEPEPEPESPISISPMEGHIPILAPGITPDAVLRAHSISPLSPPSSPEADTHDLKSSEATPGSMDTLSVDTPTWSDASLRSYLDEENDIRDLFIIVHDKTNIPPAGVDHPVTGRLFKEESKRLKEMNNQLDDMLVQWMAQRNRRSSSARNMQSSSA